MFFVITHMLIGKYYPSILTQFIIGFSCYILTFFIIKDMLLTNCLEQYKYEIVALITIDTFILLYSNRSSVSTDANELIEKPLIRSMDRQENMYPSVSLTSDSDDLKISHDLSLSLSENSIFNIPDKKSPRSGSDIFNIDSPKKENSSISDNPKKIEINSL